MDGLVKLYPWQLMATDILREIKFWNCVVGGVLLGVCSRKVPMSTSYSLTEEKAVGRCLPGECSALPWNFI